MQFYWFAFAPRAPRTRQTPDHPFNFGFYSSIIKMKFSHLFTNLASLILFASAVMCNLTSAIYSEILNCRVKNLFLQIMCFAINKSRFNALSFVPKIKLLASNCWRFRRVVISVIIFTELGHSQRLCHKVSSWSSWLQDSHKAEFFTPHFSRFLFVATK